MFLAALGALNHMYTMRAEMDRDRADLAMDVGDSIREMLGREPIHEGDRSKDYEDISKRLHAPKMTGVFATQMVTGARAVMSKGRSLDGCGRGGFYSPELTGSNRDYDGPDFG